MNFNHVKYKWQNNNTEITANILSCMAKDTYSYIFFGTYFF